MMYIDLLFFKCRTFAKSAVSLTFFGLLRVYHDRLLAVKYRMPVVHFGTCCPIVLSKLLKEEGSEPPA